eukprot:INCI16259.5.p1 GENE.INCI16259.5~~INCI16259.5.p1  ORF type:complete len:1873 (-),score=284.70 INCI16259.5:644-5869(-)
MTGSWKRYYCRLFNGYEGAFLEGYVANEKSNNPALASLQAEDQSLASGLTKSNAHSNSPNARGLSPTQAEDSEALSTPTRGDSRQASSSAVNNDTTEVNDGSVEATASTSSSLLSLLNFRRFRAPARDTGTNATKTKGSSGKAKQRTQDMAPPSPSFKFDISRVYQPRRYASKKHAFVFQVFSTSLDGKVLRRDRKQLRKREQSARATTLAAAAVSGGATGSLHFSNRFKRGQSLVLAAPSMELCDRWIATVSELNSLNQQPSMQMRDTAADATPGPSHADTLHTLITHNKRIVGHVLRLHRRSIRRFQNMYQDRTLSDVSPCSTADRPVSDRAKDEDAWDLASIVDHLHRFHGNALVFDVLCYCLAQRLALGIDSVYTLLFFLPQFLTILRLKAATPSNTSVLLEQLIFSCLITTKDNPAHQANVALKLFWALMSELPRLPSRTASSVDQQIHPESSESAASIPEEGWIRPRDIYVLRLLLILEYFMYRRPQREANREFLATVASAATDMDTLPGDSDDSTGSIPNDDISTEQNSSCLDPGFGNKDGKHSRIVHQLVRDDDDDSSDDFGDAKNRLLTASRVEVPLGWWMSPAVFRSGEAFHAKFTIPNRRRGADLAIAFFIPPVEWLPALSTALEETTLSATESLFDVSEQAKSTPLQDLKWAIHSVPYQCPRRSAVTEFEWEAPRVPRPGHYLVVVFEKASQFPVCWVAVEIVRADFLSYTGPAAAGCLSGNRMLDDFTEAKVLPEAVAQQIQDMKVRGIDPGILLYLPTLAAPSGEKGDYANGNSPNAFFPRLSPTELRLVNKFVVRNCKEEGYADMLAANRRFVAHLVSISEKLRDLEPSQRKVALRVELALLQQRSESLLGGCGSAPSSVDETKAEGSGNHKKRQPSLDVLFHAMFNRDLRGQSFQASLSGVQCSDTKDPSASCRIAAVVPLESIVFNTKERAPYLLCVETVDVETTPNSEATMTDDSSNVCVERGSSEKNPQNKNTTRESSPTHISGSGIGSFFAIPKTATGSPAASLKKAATTDVPLTPRSLYFDRLNQKMTLQPSYSCQGWMDKGAVQLVSDSIRERQLWRRRFFRLHPRSRTLAYYKSADFGARPKGTLVLVPGVSHVRTASPTETSNHKACSFMLNCQDSRGRAVHLYLSTSKHRTMTQWMHQIDLVINGHATPEPLDAIASTAESSTEIPRPDKESASRSATTSATKMYPIQGPIPLSWLASCLEGFLISKDAGMVLRAVAHGQQPKLQFTATHSRAKAQFALQVKRQDSDPQQTAAIANGIQSGDILAAVGNEMVIGYSYDQVLAYIRSQAALQLKDVATQSRDTEHSHSERDALSVQNLTFLRTSIFNSDAPLVDAIDEDEIPSILHQESPHSATKKPRKKAQSTREASAAAKAFQAAQAASKRGVYPTSRRPSLSSCSSGASGSSPMTPTAFVAPHALEPRYSDSEEESSDDEDDDANDRPRVGPGNGSKVSRETSSPSPATASTNTTPHTDDISDLSLSRQNSFTPIHPARLIHSEHTVLPQTVAAQFGELWQQKTERVADVSYLGSRRGWDLRSFVVKSYDDLRQERFVLQMAAIFDQVWADNHKLPLRLQAYSIVATGPDSGIIETIQNARSLDQIKKQLPDDHTLSDFFVQSFSATPTDLRNARIRFAESLAAYCIFTFILSVKDRHNGNIMLRSDGMLVHIDFGFVLGHAPGGRFSLERAPFKLTAEMGDILGGPNSSLWVSRHSLAHGWRW